MRRKGAGSPLSRTLQLVLAAALLLAGMSGYSGLPARDRALAARLFALHQHGVAGEAEYIARTGLPAPFVPAHCHDRAAPPPSVPTEGVVAASLSLVLCTGADAVIAQPPPAVAMQSFPDASIPFGVHIAPPKLPPRAPVHRLRGSYVSMWLIDRPYGMDV